MWQLCHSTTIILLLYGISQVVEVWSGGKRLNLHRDTTRRYWVVLRGSHAPISYALRFLTTSLHPPLRLSLGMYERREVGGVRVKLSLSKNIHNPNEADGHYLKVG